MLNLPEFKEINQEMNEHYYRFTVERKEMPYMCTNCGWIKSEYDTSDMVFRPHQVKERTVSDLPIHSKNVRIVIRHKRYKCPACNGTFYEWLDSVDRNDKVTKRFKKYLVLLALKRPFTHIADEYSVSHTSVKRYFNEYVAKRDEERYLVAPRVLGIDEAHLNKEYRGVFTDTENFKLLEITEENKKPFIKATIQSMEGYQNIEVATIDMAAGYRHAIRECVPNCAVVVDKFHVVQYVQKSFNKIRLAIKESLPKEERKHLHRDKFILQMNKEDLEKQKSLLDKRMEWFERFPELGKAYWIKEGIRDVYNQSKDKQEALERFEQWEKSIPKEFKHYRSNRRTFNNHKEEIFNYFDHRYTNAYTEAMNNVIKQVEKNGKGYNFEVLRAKVLYGTEATLKKPKYEHDMEFNSFHFRDEREFSEYYEEVKDEFVSLGVDLTTLLDIFERGDF